MRYNSALWVYWLRMFNMSKVCHLLFRGMIWWCDDEWEPCCISTELVRLLVTHLSSPLSVLDASEVAGLQQDPLSGQHTLSPCPVIRQHTQSPTGRSKASHRSRSFASSTLVPIGCRIGRSDPAVFWQSEEQIRQKIHELEKNSRIYPKTFR